MFKIGEFSKLTQVSIRMLRYYDETGLLKPAATDPWTGYRLYAVEQIPVLNKIVYLRDAGFQVAEIAQALQAPDEQAFLAQLERKYVQIEQQIRAEQEKLQRLALVKQELFSEKKELPYQVVLRAVPSYPVLALRRVIPDYYAEGGLWQEMSALAADLHLTFTGEPFSIYYDQDYRERDVDVELCAPVKKLGKAAGDLRFRYTEPVPVMACTMVYGDFSRIAGAYQAFAQWLEENSRYQMAGANRQIVHRGPWNESDPEKYLIELEIPVQLTGSS